MGKTANTHDRPVLGYSDNVDSISDGAQRSPAGASGLSRPSMPRAVSSLSTSTPITTRLYKRRFLGLAQLILLNIIISWNWLTFAPISGTASRYFNTSESNINWLSTSVMFAFVFATPATFYTLAKHGPKTSIVIASTCVLIGNWVRYAGTRSNTFPVVMLGQLIIGLAQPFTLSSPTTYSNLWFSPAGRTTATAIASLANPLGGALGQLISPLFATEESKIPNTVLYTAIIATVASLPSYFLPARPPTVAFPTVRSISSPLRHAHGQIGLGSSSSSSAQSLKTELLTLLRSREFYMIALPFATLVGIFNAFSTLINQFLQPYGFTEDEAGIAGALLIFVGLLSAAVSSPLIDRYKVYLWYVRLGTPVISLSYLIFIWAPQSRSFAYVGAVCALIGAASFGLMPVVLEFLVEVFYPLGPETSSTVSWATGQFLGANFIIIMDHLKGNGSGPGSGNPPGNMYRSLVFQAVFAIIILPLPLSLGLFGRKEFVRLRRWEAEKQGPMLEIDEGSDDGHNVRTSVRA